MYVNTSNSLFNSFGQQISFIYLYHLPEDERMELPKHVEENNNKRTYIVWLLY